MNDSYHSLKTPFLIILFFFFVLFLYTKFLGPLSFSVNSIQTTKTDFFRVEGTGKATAIPDTALISLGITKTANAVQEAQQSSNAIANKIITDLKTLGVPEKDIKTVNYTLTPTYDYASTQQIRGYSVNQTIQVQVKPLEKANQAIDIATKDGANQVGNVQFILNEETKQKVESQARKEAIENAKKKAKNLSEQTGIALGRIVDVTEETGNMLPRYGLSNSTEKAVPDNSTELNPGESTIQITITLSYELK